MNISEIKYAHTNFFYFSLSSFARSGWMGEQLLAMHTRHRSSNNLISGAAVAHELPHGNFGAAGSNNGTATPPFRNDGHYSPTPLTQPFHATTFWW